jgi:anti-sigma factor RsiW
MKCFRARPLLAEYLDGEIDSGRLAALEAHIAGCEECSARLEKLRAQWKAVAARLNAVAGAGDIPPLPADLWPGILSALDEDGRMPWLLRNRAPLLRAACVTACAFLGFAGGALLSWGRTPSAADSGDTAVRERIMVAEAFDNATFGISEEKEGLLE